MGNNILFDLLHLDFIKVIWFSATILLPSHRISTEVLKQTNILNNLRNSYDNILIMKVKHK